MDVNNLVTKPLTGLFYINLPRNLPIPARKTPSVGKFLHFKCPHYFIFFFPSSSLKTSPFLSPRFIPPPWASPSLLRRLTPQLGRKGQGSSSLQRQGSSSQERQGSSSLERQGSSSLERQGSSSLERQGSSSLEKQGSFSPLPPPFPILLHLKHGSGTINNTCCDRFKDSWSVSLVTSSL